MKTRRISWIFLVLALVSAYAADYHYRYQLSLNLPSETTNSRVESRYDRNTNTYVRPVSSSSSGFEDPFNAVYMLAAATVIFLLLWVVLLTRKRI